MKPNERNILLYLEDIKISIERINSYLKDYTLSDFYNDHKTIDAVIRNFEIIGEASKKLPAELKAKYPEVPWEEMYRLRNRISHEYFGIDYEIIWAIAEKQLPLNYLDILNIIEKEQ